jgi:hypothetical protein
MNIDYDRNNVRERLEVHFCNPVQQSESNKNKSLVYLRNTETADDQLKRAARFTSGDNSFTSKNVLRNVNGDISGIELIAQKSSD